MKKLAFFFCTFHKWGSNVTEQHCNISLHINSNVPRVNVISTRCRASPLITTDVFIKRQLSSSASSKPVLNNLKPVQNECCSTFQGGPWDSEHRLTALIWSSCCCPLDCRHCAVPDPDLSDPRRDYLSVVRTGQHLGKLTSSLRLNPNDVCKGHLSFLLHYGTACFRTISCCAI